MEDQLLKDIKRIGEALRRIPVMVAVRDPETDTYLYNNLKTTWTGHSVEEWNALGRKERSNFRVKEDLVDETGKYVRWRLTNLKKGITLQFRVIDRDTMAPLWIRCRFELAKEADNSYIIEISKDVDAPCNGKLPEGEKIGFQQFPGAIDSLYDDISLLNGFVRELKNAPSPVILSRFFTTFPQFASLVEFNVEQASSLCSKELIEIERSLEWIRNEYCETVIHSIMELRKLLDKQIATLRKNRMDGETNN